MNISQAVALRVAELLRKNNMTQYRLEKEIGLPHETLKSIMKEKTKGVNLKTIIALAYGFNMTVSEFLDCDYFKYENLNID